MTGQELASQPPRVSVVIPTRNRAAYLKDALDALRAGDFSDYDVWVMDQSDDASTEQLVHDLDDDRFHYHRMPRNGACPARNLGAALAASSLIAFLDDDCCPRSDWLTRIVAAFDGEAKLQFVFGQLKAPDHNRDDGWFPEFIPTPSLQRRSERRKIATLGAGANMACRRTFLRRVGGFDELLGPRDVALNSSDTSMCYKALRSGDPWIADGNIEVIHTHGFRPHDELGRLFRTYAREVGVDYGRFVRRRDFYAGWLFLLEQRDMLAGVLGEALRLRKPRGFRSWLAHAGGFFEGLRLPGRVGYVDGVRFRRMETTRTLDD